MIKSISKCVFIFFLVITGIHFLPPPSRASTVEVEVVHSRSQYPADGTYPILFSLKIEDQWYIHSTTEDEEGLIPTRFTFGDNPGVTVKDIRFPSPQREKFDYTSSPIEVYSGRIMVKASVLIEEDIQTGLYELQGHLYYQACSSKVCLPPEDVSVSLTIPVVPRGTPVKAMNQDLFASIHDKTPGESVPFISRIKTGFWLTLLGVFLGGLALNLTPCIYPLIPITVSYFGGKSESIRGSTIFHGIFYLTGLSITNSILGVSAALSGRLLGSILQNPWVLIFLAAILTMLALSFFGLWEIRVPRFLNRIAAKNYKGYFGTLFMGLTMGILAAPCIGPFILGLLTYVGQKGDPFLGFFYFFILSIGMGLPLCILAIFSGILDRLPMSGDWMIWIKKGMGWVMIGMAVYIITPLIPRHGLETILYSAVLIASGIHLGFFDKAGQGFKWFLVGKKILGVLLIIAGLVYGASSFRMKEEVVWNKYSPFEFVQAVLEDKPIILDFYADWCIPCKELDREVFQNREVVQLSKKFIMLRLDLTKHHPSQEKIMNQFQVRGVPAVLFFSQDGIEKKELRVIQAVDKDEFLERMNRLLEVSAD